MDVKTRELLWAGVQMAAEIALHLEVTGVEDEGFEAVLREWQKAYDIFTANA